MRYNAFAFMALVNGLAQANRFDWQSESKADVTKHEYKNPTDPVFKVEVNESQRVGNKDQLEANNKKGKNGVVDLVVDGAKPGSEGDNKGKVNTPTQAEKSKSEEAKKLEEKLEEKLEKKENELELDGASAEENRGHHHTHHSPSPDPTYDPATKTTGYHHHHSDHLQKGPYILDGEKYDYIHKPKVHHHTSYTTHAPTVSPGCVGDGCARKPCNQCNGNWAQPGCWHCKDHEATGEEAAEATKTTKHVPEKTKAKEEKEGKGSDVKTFTHGDKTIIVPKETKAPEAPRVERPHKEGPKVIVIEKPNQSEEKKKYPEKEPKKEYPKKECPKEESKKESTCNICDAVKHKHKEEPKVHAPKKDSICDNVNSCPPHGHAPAPVPAPSHHYEHKPVPAPAPPCEVKPAPVPAPDPHYPNVKPEEVKPAPVPVPAPQGEAAKPEEGKHGNAPSVPITVPKSGASYNTVSIGIAVLAGIASMTLL
ncbi:hypothetical protein FBEOM_555 [Fusarium beomiforme]|uniref:Cyclin-dependent kinase inhibitor 1c n=1 Tax=Fusarium beomiforme TaxID=44412 RepID=A0A9P5E1V1_9HYPO|nr:hypothetical protein FBEOM_555 [Fusarium beomiforme]